MEWRWSALGFLKIKFCSQCKQCWIIGQLYCEHFKSKQTNTKVKPTIWGFLNVEINKKKKSHPSLICLDFHTWCLCIWLSVFSNSSSFSMRCWGMSDRHGNPVSGQFSSWEEEEGGDHCSDQGLIGTQWHQREGGRLQHHLERYTSILPSLWFAVMNEKYILDTIHI